MYPLNSEVTIIHLCIEYAHVNEQTATAEIIIIMMVVEISINLN